ncbi:MAG TPA: hypothetical protein DCZ48_12510 [Methylococcaceae bacterium]|nr:hypothetical protein [Methylococcaceae bacterium]
MGHAWRGCRQQGAAVKPPRMGSRRSSTGMPHTLNPAKTLKLGIAGTASFLANAALFHCAVLAYNTLRWMALLSGNATSAKERIYSIRYRYNPDLKLLVICYVAV